MILKQLIRTFGKDKFNTMTKYPSILTLHRLGAKHKLIEEFTTDIQDEKMYASEKIDGTNVRIICCNNEYLVGSRREILHYSEDLFWNESMDIVNQVRGLNLIRVCPSKLTIFYGELFGGKTSSNSKNYGKDKHGFRVFDVAEIENPDSILEMPIEEISKWRESTLDSSVNYMLRYGQKFLNRDELQPYKDWYDFVPEVEFSPDDYSHQAILDEMNRVLPETLVPLSENAKMRPEGLVLRNADRSKIVKLRFEDYHKALK